MAGGFRSNIFDPILVVSQIVALQCCFYVTMGLWLVMADVVAGIELSVDQLFDYRVSFIWESHLLTHSLTRTCMLSLTKHTLLLWPPLVNIILL